VLLLRILFLDYPLVAFFLVMTVNAQACRPDAESTCNLLLQLVPACVLRVRLRLMTLVLLQHAATKIYIPVSGVAGS